MKGSICFGKTDAECGLFTAGTGVFSRNGVHDLNILSQSLNGIRLNGFKRLLRKAYLPTTAKPEKLFQHVASIGANIIY